MEYAFLIAFVASLWIYLSVRKGRNATVKRLSNIIRANIESAKPVKELEEYSKKALEQKAKDDWTQQYEGDAMNNERKHVIVRTFYARIGETVHPHWKCKCGKTDWHYSVLSATSDANKHVTDQNRGEELLQKNGERRAW